VKHYLYAFGAILCWASLPTATGSGLSELSTEELMFFSFTCAGVYLYVQSALMNRSWRIHVPGPRTSLFGVYGIFLYHYVYYSAIDNAPLAECAILTTTWSFWIVVFSSVLMFRRLKAATVLTACAGLFGAALVISAGRDLSFGTEYAAGFALALACGLIWSSFSVGLGRLGLRRDPMTIFTIYAALVSAALYMATGPHATPSATALLSAAYLGCVPLGLSFYLWHKALSGGNMVVIGYLSYLTPPLAVLMVALVHGQEIHPQVLLGMVVIIAASIGGRLSLPKPGNLPQRNGD
jgi:drug/metabolite transporter (DMT)-like permease